MKEQREFDLGSGFICSVDAADENEWNDIIQMFRDATLNQTWAFCRARSKKLSHVIVKRNGKIVAGAMLRLIILPIFAAGIAYLGSGPMWKLRDEPDDIDVLHRIIRALRLEYVVHRGLFLRISPNMFTNLANQDENRGIFEDEGFHCHQQEDCTLFLNLELSLDDLRRGLHQKWRNLLNRAEKNGFTVRVGTDEGSLKTFKGIYEEMLSRKQYKTDVNINEYEVIQSALPEPLKPTIIICELAGLPMAGGLFSTTGDTGVYLLGATSNEGMKNAASYLIQWEAIKLLKERGFRAYDLGGCNIERVPETYHFKAGVCGRNPQLFTRIGIMEACGNQLYPS